LTPKSFELYLVDYNLVDLAEQECCEY